MRAGIFIWCHHIHYCSPSEPGVVQTRREALAEPLPWWPGWGNLQGCREGKRSRCQMIGKRMWNSFISCKGFMRNEQHTFTVTESICIRIKTLPDGEYIIALHTESVLHSTLFPLRKFTILLSHILIRDDICSKWMRNVECESTINRLMKKRKREG